MQVFDKNLNYIREIRERLEPVGHRHLAQGHRRHRLHRRSQADERVHKIHAEGRQDSRDVGQAGLGPRRVRLGPRHRRRLEGRGLRRRHLRAAAAEVRAGRVVYALAEVARKRWRVAADDADFASSAAPALLAGAGVNRRAESASSAPSVRSRHRATTPARSAPRPARRSGDRRHRTAGPCPQRPSPSAR